MNMDIWKYMKWMNTKARSESWLAGHCPLEEEVEMVCRYRRRRREEEWKVYHPLRRRNEGDGRHEDVHQALDCKYTHTHSLSLSVSLSLCVCFSLPLHLRFALTPSPSPPLSISL